MGQDIEVSVAGERLFAGAAILLAGMMMLPIAPAYAQEWSGWYAGAAVSGYRAEIAETERVAATGALSAVYGYTGDGAAVGLHVGHNWQRDDTVFGLDFGLRTGEEVSLVFGPNDIFIYETDVILDLKGRFGYLFHPQTMVFGTAGVSMGSLTYDWVSAGTPETGSVGTFGYTIGVGVERLVGSNGAFRVSVDYHDRDSRSFETTILPGFSYDNAYRSVSLSVGYSFFFGR